jgi:magnesium transporter
MTPFQLNDEILSQFKSDIEQRNANALKKRASEYHYADLAEIVDELSIDEGIYLIKLLDSEKTSDVLTEVDEAIRESILELLSVKEIAEEVEELDTDDAVDLISELPEKRQAEVIAQIEDEERVQDIQELLSYDEDSAGGLMAKELVKVNENWTITKCVREMRTQASEVKRVHSIYVVDDENVLIGRLSLKDLLTANEKAKVKSIFIPKVDYVNINEKGEEVAKLMAKYDLEAVPVVDDKKKITR